MPARRSAPPALTNGPHRAARTTHPGRRLCDAARPICIRFRLAQPICARFRLFYYCIGFVARE